jgi:hypothetical protein
MCTETGAFPISGCSRRCSRRGAKRPHVPTKDEREKHEQWKWALKKCDYVPDGKLALRVKGAHYKYVGRKGWSDTHYQRLDDLLGHTVLTIEEIAAFNRVEHVEAERQSRVWEEQKCRRLRGEGLQEWQVSLGANLEEMTEEWRRARDVREFLDAYEAKLASDARSAQATVWLAAARRFAERLDPLSTPEKVAKELEPSDEVLAAFAEDARKAEEERRRSEYQRRP